MDRPPRWYDYFTFNIYFLGLTLLAQTITPIVLPLLVQRFVGEAAKATYFGQVRLWGLMAALLAQALMGMLSDRSASRWGRRRPFILVGTLVDLVFIAGMLFSLNFTGMTGFWIVFGMYLLLQISWNAPQAAVQGLIPDLVPPAFRGRFSAVKALFEIPLPLVLVAYVVAKPIAAGRIELGVAIAGGVLLGCMALTMGVPEVPLKERPAPLDWRPFLRLLLMTAFFTAIILAMGALVQRVNLRLAAVQSPERLMAILGGVGLLAMGVTIVAGVGIGVRICVGEVGCRSNPGFSWWVINRLAFLVGVINLGTFAIYFIQSRLQLTTEMAAGPTGRMMMFVGIFVLLFALPSGWLSDRIGRRQVVGISGILAALGTFVIISVPQLPAIYVGACMVGAAAGMFYTVNWALGTELVPAAEAGRYLGISNLAGAGAGAIGAYIGGPIADYLTARLPGIPGIGYAVLFGLYGLLFLLSVVPLLKIREKPC